MKIKIENLFLEENKEEESWDLMERNAIYDDGVPENALIGRFYDAPFNKESPMGRFLLNALRKGNLG